MSSIFVQLGDMSPTPMATSPCSFQLGNNHLFLGACDDHTQSVDSTDAPWNRDATVVANSNDHSSSSNREDVRGTVDEYINVAENTNEMAVNNHSTTSCDAENNRLTGVINHSVVINLIIHNN